MFITSSVCLSALHPFTLCSGSLKRETLQPNYATPIAPAGLPLADPDSVKWAWLICFHTPFDAASQGACHLTSFTNIAAKHLPDMWIWLRVVVNTCLCSSNVSAAAASADQRASTWNRRKDPLWLLSQWDVILYSVISTSSFIMWEQQCLLRWSNTNNAGWQSENKLHVKEKEN